MSATAATSSGRAGSTPPDGVEELDPAQLAPGFRAAGVACGLKGGGKTDVALLACDAERGLLGAASDPQRGRRGAGARLPRATATPPAIRAAVVNSGNANAATGEQGYRDALAMRDAAASALGLRRRAGRRRRDRDDRRPAADRRTCSAGSPRPRGALSRATAATTSPQAIMTTDRGPKRCTLRAGGVTVSAQAKGAGMIEPGFATMLCFVQTDAIVASPSGAARRRRASFERITVDGQMSTNDTVLLQATGAAGASCATGCSTPCCSSSRSRSSPTARAPTRVGAGRGRRAPRARPRPSASRARSPTRRSSRRRCTAATPTGAGSPRRPGWRSPARSSRSWGPTHIDAAGLGGDEPEAELSLRLGRGDAAAHVYFSDLTCDYVRLNSEYTT